MDALMPAYKDKKRGTWFASFHYVDYTGKRIHTYKRGFRTKAEAQKFERDFLGVLSRKADIPFRALVDAYYKDMSVRLKPTTLENKKFLIEGKIIPAFGERQVSSISVSDIRQWQNDLMSFTGPNGKPYSQTYLKTINNQLSAILNYAVKFYGLTQNPCALAGSIGRSSASGMKFYTKDQFEKFLSFEKKPAMHLALNTLFWTGMRAGELLALTMEDVHPDLIDVNKNFAVVKGQQMILTPKTEKSRRKITIPDFLYAEFQKYTSALYGYKQDERIFYFTRSALEKEMERLSNLSNLPKIRVHDLRHSHVAMLVHLGVPITEISKRLGHESIKTTIDTYGHLYPGADEKIADALAKFKVGSQDYSSMQTNGPLLEIMVSHEG